MHQTAIYHRQMILIISIYMQYYRTFSVTLQHTNYACKLFLTWPHRVICPRSYVRVISPSALVFDNTTIKQIGRRHARFRLYSLDLKEKESIPPEIKMLWLVVVVKWLNCRFLCCRQIMFCKLNIFKWSTNINLCSSYFMEYLFLFIVLSGSDTTLEK